MRNLLSFVIVMTLLAPVSVPVLEACGAKFLVATKSMRYQRTQYATRPAKILLYQHDNQSDVVAFMAALEGALNGVGHQVTVVTGDTALRDAASNNEFNVVMLQLDAARRLRNDLKSWLPRAAILPMAAFVTRPEAARAKEEFGQMLPLPTKTAQVFSLVESAYR